MCLELSKAFFFLHELWNLMHEADVANKFILRIVSKCCCFSNPTSNQIFWRPTRICLDSHYKKALDLFHLIVQKLITYEVKNTAKIQITTLLSTIVLSSSMQYISFLYKVHFMTLNLAPILLHFSDEKVEVIL